MRGSENDAADSHVEQDGASPGTPCRQPWPRWCLAVTTPLRTLYDRQRMSLAVATIGPRAFARRWRWVLGGVLLLDVLKHTALLVSGQTQPWGDSPTYWQLGEEAAGGNWWLTDSALASRTPGYPWFLAVCLALFGKQALLAVVIAQHLAVMFTTWATVWWSWRLTQREGAAVAAAMWCAFSTARPLYANWILTETWATCALTFCAVALDRALHSQRLRWTIIAGGTLGAGILIRPALLAAVPAVLIACGWELARAEKRTAAQYVSAGAGLIVMIALLAPWCLRNWLMFDRFALTVFTGRQLWKAAFDPWPGGELPLPDDGPGAALRARIADPAVDWRHNWSVAAALSRSGLKDHELDILMEQVAWQAIRRHPGQALIRLCARCATFWYVREWEPPAIDGQGGRGVFRGQREFSIPVFASGMEGALRWTPERCFPAMWLWSAAAWWGVAQTVVSPTQRRTGVLLAAIVGCTTLATAALEVPVYRYRSVLEPLMIVAVVNGSAAVARRRPSAPSDAPARQTTTG
uniref:Glycosyltransferase RgtA/B/C/D-like domain-containing protein n=1 Tax=Schlesneria paludicola TaxID=360056 RepID=A0A7C4LPY4_9PLAN